MRRYFRLFIILLIGLIGVFVLMPYLPVVGRMAMLKIEGRATVADRLEQYGEVVRGRLIPDFQKAGVAYPPKKLVLLGLKQEMRLEIYAGDDDADLRFIRAYPILNASGNLGPKLREGDCQVPEGLYTIESLNPNSRYHLSLRVGYPNEFDRQMARNEKRTSLGGDIMIHGSTVSAGCLAMGDPASEDLFILAAETGLENIRVILAPVDFRTAGLPPMDKPMPAWIDTLYGQIRPELKRIAASAQHPVSR